MITCDRTQAKHYGDETGRYWAVSQVLDVVTGGSKWIDQTAMDRGADVHIIFALALGHAIGKCDPPDVSDQYAGYYRGILSWIAEANPRPIQLEEPFRHKTLPYAGTLDFVGMLGEEFGVLDLKTGAPAKWHSMQVCAYQKMLDKAAKQWVLYVRNDGSYKQVTIKPSARDWAAFQNGLSILQWREG